MPTSIISEVFLNAALVSTAGGGIAYWLKAWLTKKMDLRFKEIEERAKMTVEIEKHQALAVLDRRNTIYPEILEIVYRLRNVCRDTLAIIPLDYAEWKA